MTRVLVIPAADASGDADEALRAAVTSRADLTLTGMYRLAELASQTPEADEDVEAAARTHLEEAEEAFSRFDYERATAQLDEARARLSGRIEMASGRERLADVHMRLALVRLVHGEREAALGELRACVHLFEECAPDPAVHPPELAALFEEVRAERAPGGALRIETEPPGAIARLDGRVSAQTPAAWSGIAHGRRYVSITRDGYEPEVVEVPITSGAESMRRVTLRPGATSVRAAAALRQLSAHGLSAEVEWRATAARLGAADALLVLEGSARVSIAAYDPRGELLGRELRDVAGGRVQIGRWLRGVLPEPRAAWYQQWRFWVPVSILLATTLATGVYLGVRTRDVRLEGGDVVLE